MKVVIIGGVAGGATAAARLRRLDEQAEIVILEKGGFVSFANCGLPYYIGGIIPERDDLLLQTPESFYRRFNIDVRVNQEAISIDRATQVVGIRDLASGREYTEPYDKLILAPGAKPNIPNVPGLDSAQVFTLRNIADTDSIRGFVDTTKPHHATIIGGGYIGIEMAESLMHAGVGVSIVQRSNHVINAIDFDMACQVHEHLRDKGVDLRLEAPFGGVREQDDKLYVLLDSGSHGGGDADDGGRRDDGLGGEELATDLVILAVGVHPDSQLAVDAGITVSGAGGIVVDEHMRTSDPNIYAVGDAVVVNDLVTGTPGQIPLAGPANRQGRIAADNICGIPSRYTATQGSAVLKAFDLTIAATGINERRAQAAGIAYDKVYLSPASHAGYYPGSSALSLKLLFSPENGRILGAQGVGLEGVDKRIDVLAVAIRAGMTAADLTELELCYAPPFSSAKDPVNMAGYLIENVLAGRVRQYFWNEVATLPRDGSAQLIDVRSFGEYQQGSIEGFANIPLDELRARLGELDCTKPVYLLCQSALRSYIAARILMQSGFAEVSHLAGGYRLYTMVSEQ
ncbi:MAG: FAD-dependent oxidoreductase [Coriobacteriales bacterium]|jgi:NADPH-dependent 2,4-dienoyl-CoA reductase/sulfur reductase-like enzyme/rhodanese-related sulfurtransferase|nr:FAD-dependent oxidoreductase [Coriobacteriales bacterium]